MSRLFSWLTSPAAKMSFSIICVILSMLSKNGVIPFDPVIGGVPFHDFILGGIVTSTGTFTKTRENTIDGNRWL